MEFLFLNFFYFKVNCPPIKHFYNTLNFLVMSIKKLRFLIYIFSDFVLKISTWVLVCSAVNSLKASVTFSKLDLVLT